MRITKEHILDEIRRVAQKDGGRAPGYKRFKTETGIRETDWSGRYWVRWGDALRDAGFQANEWGDAYDEEHIIAKAAALTRELGHVPGGREIKFKRKQDPSFPSDHVFRRRWSKRELSQRVLEYCRSHQDFADVIPLCGPALVHEQPGTEEADTLVATPEMGFVYLFKSGRYYKVGRSNATGRREYEVGLQLPEKLRKIHEIKTDDPPGIEAYWHGRFAAKRLNGEWFDLDAADVSAFKRRKFM